MFAGANLTAALNPKESIGASGIDRNPLVENSLRQRIRVGSNPFTRSAKCMLCHLGPEQTDHSINISHGLLKNNAEFEYPTPPVVRDPTRLPVTTFADGLLPAPEPSGPSRAVGGLILAEEVGEGRGAGRGGGRAAQLCDASTIPPRRGTTGSSRSRATSRFGDQGVYNIGLRPSRRRLGSWRQ